MAYAALVHGATGLCWFSLDIEDVRRNASGWGISPTPMACYNEDGEGCLADEEQLGTVRELWDAVAEVNHEVAALRDFLFAPTSTERYRVYVSGDSASDTPVRTMLKQVGGRTVLIAVNMDNAPLGLRVRFPLRMRITGGKPLFTKRPEMTISHCVLMDRLQPFDVGVYELTR